MYLSTFQAQLVVLAAQISWSESTENALQGISTQANKGDLGPLNNVMDSVEATLNVLADSVLHEQPPVRRKKLESLVSLLFFICSVFISLDLHLLWYENDYLLLCASDLFFF